LAHGESLATARTVAVNVFVFGELFYLFNCRSLRCSLLHVGLFSNIWLIAGVLLMIGAQLLFTYWPPMNQLFGSAPIAGFEWLIIGSVGMTIYLVVEVEKGLYCRLYE
jgi:magnesium-transporting ATPase (P-type)